MAQKVHKTIPTKRSYLAISWVGSFIHKLTIFVSL